MVFCDVTDNPVAWYNSINQLQKAFSYYGNLNGWEAPVEKKKVLLNYVIQEYEAFMAKYGDKQCPLEIAKDLKVKTFNEVMGHQIRLLNVPNELEQEYEDRIKVLERDWLRFVKESGLYRE